MNYYIFGFFLVLFVTGGIATAETHKLPENSMYHLDSKWKTEDGNVISLSDLQGDTHIMTMVFTSCEYACPMIISDIHKITKGLPKKIQKKVRISLFSFDPEKDTPGVLKKFSTKHMLGSNWNMYTSDESTVRELAAVLGVKYKKMENGMFGHSNVISIVDSNGVIVHQQNGLYADPAPAIHKIKEQFE